MHGVSKWFMVFTWYYYQSSLFSKCDVQPIMKCLWIIVVSVCRYLYGCIIVGFHWNYSLCVQFHLSVHTGVHNCVCCRLSFFWLCVHSLYHPWPSTEKGSGVLPRVHPLWSEGVRRIGFIACCADSRGYIAGLGHYSLAPHSSRANGLPTVQCCQLSGWMCCAPAEMASWPVWWCCEVEGQLF